jgi:hypothetical protein
MNKSPLVLVALFLGACATSESEEDRPDAIDDFIHVSELEEVGSIRTMEQVRSDVLNDNYVIVTSGREQFLLAYRRPCPEVYDRTRHPDYRSDPRAIWADRDTFRGCRIKAFYPINEAQAAELEQIAQLPGER